ncbi:MAG: hypothetical protein M3Y35_11175, partial [Actinomycetota bacterium]|nr:hypothetical protein [Actinomycetota bacterium]
MRRRSIVAAIGAVAIAVSISVNAAASTAAPSAASARNHAVRVISVHSVNLSALPRARANHAWNHGPLLRNGQFSGNLPVSPSRGSKARGPLTSVTPKLHLGFNGIAFAAAN